MFPISLSPWLSILQLHLKIFTYTWHEYFHFYILKKVKLPPISHPRETSFSTWGVTSLEALTRHVSCCRYIHPEPLRYKKSNTIPISCIILSIVGCLLHNPVSLVGFVIQRIISKSSHHCCGRSPRYSFRVNTVYFTMVRVPSKDYCSNGLCAAIQFN